MTSPGDGPAPVAAAGRRLADLSRKDLVELAKTHGIKANQKSSLIVAALHVRALPEFEDADDDSNSPIDAVSAAAGGGAEGEPAPPSAAAAAAAVTSPSPNKGKNATSAGKIASRANKKAAAASSPAGAAAAFGHTTTPTKSRLPPPPAPPAPPAFRANTKRQKELPLSPRNQAQMAKYRERQQIARKELDAPPQAAFGHAPQDTHSRVPPSTAKEEVVPFKANTKKLKAMELSDRNKRQMEKFRERQKQARTGETKKAAFGHGTLSTKSRIPLGTAAPNGSVDGGGDGSTVDDVASSVSTSSSLSSSTAGAGAAGAPKGRKKAVPAWKVASRDFRRKNNAGVAAQGIGSTKSAAGTAAFGHGVCQTKSRLPTTTTTTTSSAGGEDGKETAKAFRANTRKLKTMEMTERNRKQMEKFRQRQVAGREERMKKAAQEKEIMCSRD